MNHTLPESTALPIAEVSNPPAASIGSTRPVDAPVEQASASAPDSAKNTAPKNHTARPLRTHPLLEQMAQFYPHLFGEVFLPLKRGIFQDLLSAHPEVFDKEGLKTALSIHTRSSRYLTAVASGQQRHDLGGQAVEAMAPQHVYQALVEVFRRRQGRSQEDLRPKLVKRMVQAYEASGLSREAYDALTRGRDETVNALLDEALAEAAMRAARDEAQLRAFESSGQSVEGFANMYGLNPREAAQTLARAKAKRTLDTPTA